MQLNHLKIISMLLLGFGLTNLTAQESVNATGGNASDSGGSVSYSIGQLAFQIKTGTDGSVIQGVQQPYEISIVTAIEETHGISLSVSAYPNPTDGFLQLKVDVSTTAITLPMTCLIYDMDGKLLQSKQLSSFETQIDMGMYVQSVYFVKVIQNNKLLKTFKIIKK
jgi:hypothetical protein